MNPQDTLLAQLRDIHSAPDAPWWPPAPGWWALALLVLIALTLLARHGLRHYRAQQRRQRLLNFIEWIDTQVDPVRSPGQYLADLNRVFKLVALRAFPEQDCAQLNGSEWVAFLRDRLNPEAGSDIETLAEGPYRPESRFDADKLSRLAKQWVRQYG